MVWYSHFVKNFPQFIVIHTSKGFGIVNKVEIDVYSGNYFQKEKKTNLQMQETDFGCQSQGREWGISETGEVVKRYKLPVIK